MISCSSNNKKTETPAGFTANFEKVIDYKSDDENLDAVLVYPSLAKVDDSGNAFIYEDETSRILKFDPQGNFIKAIGREGNGPGEFNAVNFMEIHGDTLYTYSGGSSLFQTFDLDGKLGRSFSAKLGWEFGFFPTKDGYNLTYSHSRNEGEDGGNLIGKYDFNLELSSPSGISKRSVYSNYFTKELENITFGTGGDAISINDNQLLFAPEFHHGKIYELTFNKEDESWSITDSLQTEKVEKLYSELPEGDEKADISTYNAGMTKVISIRYLSLTLGLYKLNDGKIAHFVLKDLGENREVGVHIYSEDRTYLGYDGLVNSSSLSQENFIMMYDFYDAKNDIFYHINIDEETEEIFVSGKKLVLNFN